MSKDDVIRVAYYNPEKGFVGIEKLYRKLKPQGVSREDIRKFLKKQEVYQVNKKNNKKMASFIPRYPLQEFQIDLIYLDDKHLNKASYGLCCIDAFSKKADVQLMKRKTKEETVDGMMDCMRALGVPEMIYCDEGSEFNNAPFKKMCKELDIKLVFTIRHAPIVERFNRTIKEMLHKYLQSTGTKTIVNVLPKIVRNYNNSYHSIIGMAPNEVNEDTMHIAQINLIRKLHRVPYVEYKVGDRVRVQVKPKSFVKGYRPKYSKTIYEITKKGDGWYGTSKDNRQYLKSNLQLVDESEINPELPDLEGTREGHLREIRNRPREEFESAAQIEEEPQRRRSARERKPASYVVDERYGKVRWS
jgi:hypothetical protein